MATIGEGTRLTRQSGRERVLSTKAADASQGGRSENEDEESIRCRTPPVAPKRTVKGANQFLREPATKSNSQGIVADKIKAILKPENAQVEKLTRMVAAMTKSMDERQDHYDEQTAMLMDQTAMLKDQTATLKETIKELRTEVGELTGLVHAMSVTSQAPTTPGTVPSISYAEVARTPPVSTPSNIHTLSTTPTASSYGLYCTVDTSRVEEDLKSQAQPGPIRKAVEEEMRTKEELSGWRCATVTKDARMADRVKIACRSEEELQKVKQAAERTLIPGARVMRDQLYPVKVDNANRTGVIDQEGNVLSNAAETLGIENEVTIAKIAWLSLRNSGKAYGSMVIYVTKGSDAVRLLQEQYFNIAGESANTRVFERRDGPTQCYNCQGLGHKAYACTKVRVCARCAEEGHAHKDCKAIVPKCALCSGPHESYSRNCRLLSNAPRPSDE